MTKLTLSDVSNILGNPTSAANTINANNQIIEDAFEQILSRDGESPNQMTSDIDMNHNDIINVDNIHADVLVLNGQTVTPVDLVNLPATVMLKTTYDPNGVNADVFNRRYQGDFNTESDFTSANIPTVVQYVTTAGYYTTGDGGGHLKKRIATPVPVEAWHKQSADGAWWEIANQDLSVKMFGAWVDGTSDDAAAINNTLEFGALIGRSVYQPAGTSSVGSTITLKNGAKWVGSGLYSSFVKRLTGHSGALVKTENFDTLTGTSDAFAADVPEAVSIEGITFDGNYQNTARTAYVQATGEGLRLFSRKLGLYVRVFNTPGVGVWAECPGGNGPTPLQPGFSREAKINLYIHQTQYEGLVWKGPADVKIDWILQADAGSRIVADELNGKVNSPNFGSVNGNQCDGIVINGIGAEIGAVHAFGNLGGGGFDWRGGRINIDLLMVESCHFGGLKINGNASGMISKLDVHRTGGFSGDTTADFVYAGTGSNNFGVEIGVCSLYRSSAAHTGSRNGLEITGDFLDIGVLKLDLGSTATAGHGLYVDVDTASWITVGSGEISRCKGTAPDGLSSAAVYRKATGNGNNLSIKVNVRDCDVAFRSAGTPRIELVDLQFFLNAGQLAFAGDVKTQAAQTWNIRGTINGVAQTSRFMGITAAFDTSITTEQSLTVPHGLIYAPPFGKYHPTGLFDTPTDLSTGDVAYYETTAADATNITVVFKMATADATNTAPRVGVIAEI